MTKRLATLKADPDGMTADELRAAIDRQSPPEIVYEPMQVWATPPQPETVYDPVHEIVKGLNRIADTLEEQTAMAREEYRSKGFVIPVKKN